MRSTSRRALSILSAALVLATLVARLVAQTPLNQVSAADTQAGWVSLFDGKTLDGWRGYKRADATGTRWTIADGQLCVTDRTSAGAVASTGVQRDLVSTALYDQFDLRWEWRVGLGGNSGLKYFVQEDQDSAIGHEYQMIDDERHPDARRGPKWQTGGLYDLIAASNRPTKPAGEWNQSRVVVSGTTVQHWLNGAQVLEYQLGSQALKDAIATSKFSNVARFGTPQKAHILLQDHGEAVCFRNIAVKPGR